MSNHRTIVMDLDGTLCTQGHTGTYHLVEPKLDMIKKVNELWTEGWEIVIFTARGMVTCAGNIDEIEKNYRDLTETWLKENRVCYTRLMFGKPAADYYVDDKSLSFEDFLKGRL